MDRLTLPVVLVVAILVVASGTVGAVAAPLASGDAAATVMQEGDGNTTTTPTATPTPSPTATPTANESNTTDETNSSDTTNATSEPPTFGAVVSSFMQTSAADAETEVEDGLFEAKFERSNASERARLVSKRATSIGDRIAELREERARLLGGENVTVRERAQAARLAAKSNGLANSINETADAAQRAMVGVDTARLEELRSEARNLTGPEVSELARGLVDEERPRRGPPSDRGPKTDRGPRDGETDAGNVTDAANETATNETDSPGRSGDAGKPTDDDGTSTAAEDGRNERPEDRSKAGERGSSKAPEDRTPRSDGAGDKAKRGGQSDTGPPGSSTPTATEDGGEDGGTESAE